MPQGLSLSKIFVVAILGLAIGFGLSRLDRLPVEFGGTQTGSVAEPSSFQSSRPEFDEDDSTSSGDLVGVTSTFDTVNTEPVLDEAEIEMPVRTAASNRKLLDDDNGTEPAPIQLIGNAQSNQSDETIDEKPIDEPSEKKSESQNLSDEPVGDQPDAAPVRIAKKPGDNDEPLEIAEIEQQIKSGRLVEAHKALSKIFWQQPEKRSRIQEQIDATAKAIYFSPQPHIQEPYVIQAGDQLRKVALKHRIPWQYLSRLNRIDPKRIREGQKLKVIDGPFGAVVTLGDFELVLHHNGQYVRRYRVCIGKDDSSPVGKFKVLNKVTSPQYTDPDGKVFAGNDPKNPLGKFWLDLGESYGIHGTIEPNSIGKAESRGCIRMLNEDVGEVYDLLEVGAEVIIRP